MGCNCKYNSKYAARSFERGVNFVYLAYIIYSVIINERYQRSTRRCYT